MEQIKCLTGLVYRLSETVVNEMEKLVSTVYLYISQRRYLHIADKSADTEPSRIIA